MTEIEKQALALVNEVRKESAGGPLPLHYLVSSSTFTALCIALEQKAALQAEFDQYKRDVSDAIKSCMLGPVAEERLSPFILSIPDEVSAGLALAIEDTLELCIGDDDVNKLCAALAARGLKIVEAE